MRAEDLKTWEDRLMKEISQRRQLGGYSPESMTILGLCELSFELCRHLRERLPRPKTPKESEE